jgi:Asp-tRNA(Asn)/Glu-tRNA(Gln) amidotransferase B subunit
MSAFIVSNKTINRVLGLYAWVDTTGQFDAQAKGAELMRMNAEAVNFRYSESYDPPAYSFRPDNLMSLNAKVQAVKSARCLRYQCCEGDVPESQLYKELSDIVEEAQSMIVAGLPEYESAEWD